MSRFLYGSLAPRIGSRVFPRKILPEASTEILTTPSTLTFSSFVSIRTQYPLPRFSGKTVTEVLTIPATLAITLDEDQGEAERLTYG